MSPFENPWVRFSLSGTLILLFGVVDGVARRAAGRTPHPVPAPPWTHTVVFVSLTAFYALIGPTGGAFVEGLGNLAGIGAALAAMTLRLGTRRGAVRVRQPAAVARLLFYAALPAAVGTPWGWAVFTLPALVTSAWCAVREDRVLLERLGEEHRARMRGSHRWVPGVW
jgi:protein-S-isoprenylcysteine O-methyltransferase Ste14